MRRIIRAPPTLPGWWGRQEAWLRTHRLTISTSRPRTAWRPPPTWRWPPWPPPSGWATPCVGARLSVTCPAMRGRVTTVTSRLHRWRVWRETPPRFPFPVPVLRRMPGPGMTCHRPGPSPPRAASAAGLSGTARCWGAARGCTSSPSPCPRWPPSPRPRPRPPSGPMSDQCCCC